MAPLLGAGLTRLPKTPKPPRASCCPLRTPCTSVARFLREAWDSTQIRFGLFAQKRLRKRFLKGLVSVPTGRHSGGLFSGPRVRMSHDITGACPRIVPTSKSGIRKHGQGRICLKEALVSRRRTVGVGLLLLKTCGSRGAVVGAV